MKVLFTKRNYAPMGGSESLTYQWATRLAARGHDVRVVCGQAFDSRRRFEDHGVDVIQVKPRGGLLGQVADASMMLDMMPIDELEQLRGGPRPHPQRRPRVFRQLAQRRA